jgi:LPS-assembly protein
VQPDWWISARKLTLNQADDVGEAEGGVLYFKGIPLLGAPYVSFPLSDKRKSGLLPPTINIDNISGLEYTQPYYWNIAPHLDATFYPTLMTKRGLDLGAEFRYLQTPYHGQMRGSFMPNDQLLKTNRWGLTAQHHHTLNGAWLGQSALGLRLNLNRVSDDAYWRDFPKVSPALTQRLLPNELALSGQRGALGWTAGIYTWQTLQDAAAPIVAPYNRIPQVDVRWGHVNQQVGAVGGLDWSVSGQFTRFQTPRSPSVTAQLADIDGSRLLGIAQISRPWQTPGGFVRPKAQLHMTHYSFDQALWSGQRSTSRVVPTLSVDSGLVFERQARFFGRDVLQTLEPRAMYVYTPYRDQSALPNYDSAAKDFNFGTAWAENDFAGHDRISDTHALTVGASTRLIDPTTGAEAVRLGLAQRLRLSDQRVTLPGGAPITDTVSDVLLGASIQWDPKWQFEGGVQFNPHAGRSQRTTLTARYHPTRYRVFSAAYRLQRAGGLLPASEQLDVGWQWPLNDLWDPSHRQTVPTGDGKAPGPQRWYGVGRINYSMPDRKVVDLVLGVEYDACCWIARVVLERLQRSNANTGQRILFQLEFNGFSRIGSNPLQTLRDNVPRYQYLRDEVKTPSRFGRYE